MMIISVSEFKQHLCIFADRYPSNYQLVGEERFCVVEDGEVLSQESRSIIIPQWKPRSLGQRILRILCCHDDNAATTLRLNSFIFSSFELLVNVDWLSAKAEKLALLRRVARTITSISPMSQEFCRKLLIEAQSVFDLQSAQNSLRDSAEQFFSASQYPDDSQWLTYYAQCQGHLETSHYWLEQVVLCANRLKEQQPAERLVGFDRMRDAICGASQMGMDLMLPVWQQLYGWCGEAPDIEEHRTRYRAAGLMLHYYDKEESPILDLGCGERGPLHGFAPLTSLPDMVQCFPQLRYLYLNGQNGRIALSRRLRHQLILDFTERTSSFIAYLSSWDKEFVQRFLEGAQAWISTYQWLLQCLPLEERRCLMNYLSRLCELYDYAHGIRSKKEDVVQRMHEILQLACSDESFRRVLVNRSMSILYSSDNLNQQRQTCGDGVATVWNDLHILYQLYTADNDIALAQLAIRAQRYRLLQQHAIQLRAGNDLVETILYLHISLRERLDLPIPPQDMLYPGVSGVTDAQLGGAAEFVEQFSDQDLLEQSQDYGDCLARYYPQRAAEIKEQYDRILEEVIEYTSSLSPSRLLDSLSPEAREIIQQTPDQQRACELVALYRTRALAHIIPLPELSS